MSGGRKAFAIAAALAAVAGTAGSTLSAYSSSASNSGSTFATAASYGSPCPNTTIVPAHITGFESGRRGASSEVFMPTGTSAGTAIDTTVVRSGTYSMKGAPTGSAAYMGWTFPPTLPTSATIRFAIRFETLPTADVSQLFAVRSAGTPAAQLKYVNATKTFSMSLVGNTTSTVTSAVTLTTGRWYVIDVKYDVSTTTHRLDWRIDAAAQTGTTVTSTAMNAYQIQFGTNTTDTYTAYYDDVMITSSGTHYPLGDGRVYSLHPDGMGSLAPAGSNFVHEDGSALSSASWQRIDEVPTNSLADYISQTTASTTSYAEFTFSNTTHTCIRAAMGYALFHTATSGTSLAKVMVYDGTAGSALRDGDFNTTTGIAAAKGITPATSWSQSALNGLVGRFGYWQGGNKVPSPLLDSAMIEYEVPQ